MKKVPATHHAPSGRANGISRRRFITTAGAALAVPAFVPGHALGLAGSVAASNRITLGVIGCGNMGAANTKAFLDESDCQVVAACDVDKNHLAGLVNVINENYGNQDCKAYHDHRELLARKDIDAVMIALPDHWHAMAAVAAARQNKDIYGEKPLAHTIAEQQAIVHAVHQHDRIWQTGSWQRSVRSFHKARKSSATVSSAPSSALKSACPKITTMQKKPRRTTCCPRSRRRNWIMISGLVRHRKSPTSGPASTVIGAGITTSAGDS